MTGKFHAAASLAWPAQVQPKPMKPSTFCWNCQTMFRSDLSSSQAVPFHMYLRFTLGRNDESLLTFRKATSIADAYHFPALKSLPVATADWKGRINPTVRFPWHSTRAGRIRATKRKTGLCGLGAIFISECGMCVLELHVNHRWRWSRVSNVQQQSPRKYMLLYYCRVRSNNQLQSGDDYQSPVVQERKWQNDKSKVWLKMRFVKKYIETLVSKRIQNCQEPIVSNRTFKAQQIKHVKRHQWIDFKTPFWAPMRLLFKNPYLRIAKFRKIFVKY